MNDEQVPLNCYTDAFTWFGKTTDIFVTNHVLNFWQEVIYTCIDTTDDSFKHLMKRTVTWKS